MDASTDQNTDPVQPSGPPQPDQVPSEPTPRRTGNGGAGKKTSIRVGAVIAIALAAAFAVFLLVRNNDNSSSATTTAQVTTTANVVGAPRVTSAAALRKLAAAGTTIYWAGPKESGQTLTLVKSSNGSYYVRYLPAGVTVTDPIPASLVVGTYPLKNALAAVKRAAKSADAVSVPIDNGGMAVYSKSKPTNVYFAYPSTDIQVEVYDPTDGNALQLVTSGSVTQITP
jgi:hypothetical protein